MPSAVLTFSKIVHFEGTVSREVMQRKRERERKDDKITNWHLLFLFNKACIPSQVLGCVQLMIKQKAVLLAFI